MSEPFDATALGEIVTKAKKQIRSRMKALRGGYSAAALAERSSRIVENVLAHPRLSEARSVASFWPMIDRGEVDLRPLDERLRARGVQLYYPFMERISEGRVRTGFREAESSAVLEDRGHGFREPPEGGPSAGPGDVDVVIVPALAADATGHRIGYGAGYYDATLADICPPAHALIVVYDFQLLAELPHEAHDRACDSIVTDTRTLLVGA